MLLNQWIGSLTFVVLVGSVLTGCNAGRSDAVLKSKSENIRMLPPVKVVGKKTRSTNPSAVVGKSEQKKLMNPLKKEEKTQVRNISSD